jgi:hypothetical protein
MILDPWMRLVLAVLATWRVTHLLALEDGPWDVIARLRLRLGDRFWGRLLDCFYCLSLWVAAAAVAVVQPPLREAPLWWLACSGGACLLQRLGPQPQPVHLVPVDRLEQTEPGHMTDVEARDALARAEEHDHGMLRTAASEQQSTGDESAIRPS